MLRLLDLTEFSLNAYFLRMSNASQRPPVTRLESPSGLALLIDGRTPAGAAAIHDWLRRLKGRRRAIGRLPALSDQSGAMAALDRRLRRDAANDLILASRSAIAGRRSETESDL